jgi:hypothetical protein
MLLTALPGLALAAGDVSVPREDKGAAKPAAQQAALVGEAEQLVAFAREHKSVVAMVTAAQMLRQAGVKQDNERAGKPVAKGSEKPGTSGEGAGAAPEMNPIALLDEARSWAGGNKTELALLDEAKAQAAAPAKQGDIMGPGCSPVYRVQAGYRNLHTINFVAREWAVVEIVTDRDNDIDCAAYDQADQLLRVDTGYSPNCSLSWYTQYGGPFTIVVDNTNGDVWSAYRVCTN